MQNLTDELKKLILAGIGSVAVGHEKSSELLDELVKKGELTLEQGKVLNEELKHNVKESVKDSIHVETLSINAGTFEKMSDDELSALEAQIAAVRSARANRAAEKPTEPSDHTEA